MEFIPQLHKIPSVESDATPSTISHTQAEKGMYFSPKITTIPLGILYLPNRVTKEK